MSFVHLNVHSEYSLLTGYCRINDIVKNTKKLNMSSVAITDYGVMFGCVEFYKKAKAEGIKPIIGCEVYIKNKGDNRLYSLILLCKNEVGYRNLCKIVSASYTDSNFKNAVTIEYIKKYSEGLIALSGGSRGYINSLILQGLIDNAKENICKYVDIFGEDNFYLELHNHGLSQQRKINELLYNFSKELKVNVVATNDVHYMQKEDSAIHDILVCIRENRKINDVDRERLPNREFYFKTEQEMIDLFRQYPEAITNTVRIAQKCNYDFEFGKYHLPEFSSDLDFNSAIKLRELAISGLKEKYDNYNEYIKRLDYELKIIDDMGYNDYFLIVWDFVKYAKDNNIFVGPGRGSGGGSLVGYCLNITTIDPIKYSLIFERFLNPDRITMPDFDIDFEDERRGEVIEYVQRKYGKDRVAQIITFGTLKAKAAIKDVGRVMGVEYKVVDRITKAIPNDFNITIDDAIKGSEELRKQLDDKRCHQIIENAKKIEFIPRHSSTHAAGVVISKKELVHYLPLYMSDGNVSTQYTMNTLEELGIVKMDFLGLTNLKIIKNTLKNIDEEIDISNINYDDKKTFDMLSKGRTLGIFQLESKGMQKFIRELKPTSIEDIIAGISLYRPGPMDSIPKYIKNKKNPKNIKYLCPQLEDILKSTYGCLVYQEQVMQIFRKLGGYTYAQSDIVRRAISKKKMNIMQQEREKFIIGALKNGVTKENANIIYDDIIDFANYAFNKSHATGYAMIAYQSAYLKANYTKEFMSALMSSVSSESKLAKYIREIKKYSIQLLLPSINFSHSEFVVENDAIRFGLSSIKNVGSTLSEEIILKRKEKKYTSFDDFLERLDNKFLNKKAIEALIKAGAFDELGITRRTLISIYENKIDDIQKSFRTNAKGQINLFGEDTIREEIDLAEYDNKTLLKFEKEVIGANLNYSPIEKYYNIINKLKCDNVYELKELNKKNVRVIGKKVDLKVSVTKTGKEMAFIVLEDGIDTIDIVVFPEQYIKFNEIICNEDVLYIEGNLNSNDFDTKLYLQNAKKISDLKIDKKLYIKINSWDKLEIEEIKRELIKNSGKSEVVLYNKERKEAKAFIDIKVNITDSLIKKLEIKYGVDNIKIV